MKVHYHCEYCGEAIAVLDVETVDEVRFGFDCLTDEERKDIIRLEPATDTMYVKSLCDNCIETFGIADEQPSWVQAIHYLH